MASEVTPAASYPEEGWNVAPSGALEAVQLKFSAELKVIVHWAPAPKFSVMHNDDAVPFQWYVLHDAALNKSTMSRAEIFKKRRMAISSPLHL
jgi:hypothetical protein